MFPVPRRSITGCITCKQRKKKCDETRPVCQRCARGGFNCLGYDQQHTRSTSAGRTERANVPGSRTTPDLDSEIASTVSLLSPSSCGDLAVAAMRGDSALMLHSPARDFIKTQKWQLDPLVIDQIVPLVLSQYSKAFKSVAFKPLASPVEKGLVWRINYSEITRWSMLIGSKIMEAISEGNSGLHYLNWMTRLYQHIVETPARCELSLVELDARLSGLIDIASYALILLGTSTGYHFFKHGLPVFLQLAVQSPELWSDNGAILIPAAIRAGRYDLSRFVIFDTMNSLVLGVPPLLCYDTSALWVDVEENTFLEWVHGFPAGFIALIARINSWRVSRINDQPSMDPKEWGIIESRLQSWSPKPDWTSEAVQGLARMAIQECWRNAILIYLYMGMAGVNSMDPRVEAAVRQIVQLSGTIEPENPLVVHTLIPCLIAGAVARREKHRATLRKRLIRPQNIYPLIVREVDFVAVLDHLWHGAAAGGKAITWEDYVEARSIVMPIAP